MIPVNYSTLPKRYQSDALAYVQTGCIPGAFLEAVLANELTQAVDFFEASGRDPYNAADVRDFMSVVAWASEQCPVKARGSRGAVTTWIDRRGLDGIQTRESWMRWALDAQPVIVNAETASGLTRATREFMRMIGGRRGF
jgi:hypothetical protein